MTQSERNLKILVVDDDRSTRMLLKAFLGRSGHAVIEAANGMEAIECFEREKPDLILMDVTMPVMTGYESAAIIKQKVGSGFVPIIFLTGLNDDGSLAKCVESGGDDFLVKPFNSVLLGAKITAMKRIQALYSQLENYQQKTEQEIALTHHVFNSVTKRMSLSNIPGLEQWVKSAGHFSGDMVLYEKAPSGRLNVMLGDFTGHGFSAAIGALPVSDVFFTMTRRELAMGSIVAEINRKLKDIMPLGHFCATGFISCDPVSKKVEVFNAGLPPIILLSPDGKIQHEVKSGNLALGILSANDFSPETETIEPEPASKLVIYSDGLTDVQNPNGEIFGENRLFATLGAIEKNAKVADTIRQKVEDFAQGREPDDDITLVSIRF